MKSERDPDAYTMGLLEHLRELRKRLIYSIIAIIGGGLVAYCFSSQVFTFLSAPYFTAFSESPLIGTSPAEAWVLKVKVALFCGGVLMSPVIFYQGWAFIAPGLYERERALVVPFVIISSILFVSGAAFCYYAVLPFSMRFFYDEYRSIGVTPTIRIGDHLSMTITSLLGFGAIFELPVLTYFLTRASVIDHHSLIEWYRHAIVAIFVIAAVLTPPDVVSQLLMAGPLLVLYGASILVAYVTKPLTEQDESVPTAPIPTSSQD